MKIKGFLVESDGLEEWLVLLEEGSLVPSRAGRLTVIGSDSAREPLDHAQMQQITAAVILELNRFFARLPRLPRSSSQGRRAASRVLESQASSSGLVSRRPARSA